MKLEFRATEPAELPTIKAFLTQVFAAPADAPFARDAHLRWKYFVPRDDSPASRSFVLQNESSFAAHACAWPFQIVTKDAAISGVHPIDWVASSAIPGAGALLLRQMRTLAPVSCCIGGTDIAQKVIAQTGYRPSGEIKFYSRPLRPWKQFLSHQNRNYKLPARFLRNLAWSAKAGASPPRGWTAQEISPKNFPDELAPVPSESMLVAKRSASLFEYFAQCPIARYKLYIASRYGVPAGYFLLSFTPGQAHIADAWSVDGGVENWRALYKLAVSVADANEITTGAAIPAAQSALEWCGFRVHSTLPVMLFDSKKLLPSGVAIHFQMIDNDFSFLHTGKPSYWT